MKKVFVTVRFSESEKSELMFVANFMQRTPSDMIRQLVSLAYNQIKGEQNEGDIGGSNDSPAGNSPVSEDLLANSGVG